MKKQLSYEQLEQRVAYLEQKLATLNNNNHFGIENDHFFQICENSKNAIALLKTPDKGKSFYISY